MHVLIVEDEWSVSSWLTSKLSAQGHRCVTAQTGARASDILGEQALDIVLLDRRLPDMDGIELLAEMCALPQPLPVIILSAIDVPSERVAGLKAGARDYMGKPFDFPELLVRMELLTHRPASNEQFYRVIDDLHIDLVSRTVTRAGQRILLTSREFAVLCVLSEHRGQLVPRDMLLEKVWGLQFDPRTNLIDVHVSKIRNKIDKGFSRPLLKTVRSMGYVLG